jgi:hypothetical protein
MHGVVLIQLSLLLETFVAHFAGEGFLLRMYSQMVQHVTLLVKLLLAGGFSTDQN